MIPMTRIIRMVFLAFALTAALLIAEPSAQAQTKPHTQTKTQAENRPKTQTQGKPQTKAKVQMLAARTRLVFEPNRGQAPANVQWLARGSRFIIGLTSDGAALEFRDEGNPPPAPQALRPLAPSAQPGLGGFAPPAAPKEIKSSLVKLHLAGSGAWKTQGVSPTGGISNYFIGNTPKNWHVDIPHYAQVKAAGVYNGIDLVFQGDQGALEYHFVVAPGADPRQIELQFEGAKGLRVDKGDLVLTTPGGADLRHVQPKIYQEVGGKKVTVKGGFEMRKEGSAGFTLGSYDPKLPLVIDPTITFVTFLAGSDFDEATAVAVDPLFNSYVTGYTYSANFPAVGEGSVGQSSHADAFFTKLSPNGTILSSTYLGGSDDDMGFGIAVDASGVYVTGQTQSSDFPHFPLQPGLQGFADAFVTKFSLLGDTLFYSRYLGGSDWDGGSAIAVDSNRSPYIVGTTFSNDFPVTVGAFQTHAGNPSDGHAFVTKLSPSGALLSYSTYLASDGADTAGAVAVDSSFSAIVSGDTCDFTFPFAGFFSQSFPPGCSAFVTKLSPAGDSLIYSTSLGPLSYWGSGVSADSAGNAYVTGNGYTGLGTPAAAAQAYVTKLSPVGASLYFKQLVGTDGSSVGRAIATDADGDTWVAGSTSSTTFPGAPPITPNPTAGFLVKLGKNGTGPPVYTVLLGASVNGVAVIKPRPRFPSQSSFPTIFTAGYRFTGGTASSNLDAFVVRVDEGIIIVNQP